MDATCGNGHDTLFLARQVGPSGRVYAFDVQAAALRVTRERLASSDVLERATLFEQGHEAVQEALPTDVRGRVQAIMFNLGYLPGSDKTRITRPETTIPALDAALAVLAPGGVVTVVCYLGHPGGRDEAPAVEAWAEALDPHAYRALTCRPANPAEAPRLLIIQRDDERPAT